MPKECTIVLSPEQYGQEGELLKRVAKKIGVSPARITTLREKRRSIDARKRTPQFVLLMEVWVDEPFREPEHTPFNPQDVHQAPEVHIAGLGPAGLFAAIRLIEQGLKPIVIERGKDVRARRRDLAILNREGLVSPESNYCFGEGGAGTFSDGKLYTRSHKRGDVRRILDLLVHFGASEDICVDAHPHIGTNKLPGIVQAIREQIVACGGEVHFGTRLTGLKVQEGRLTGIEVNGQETWAAKNLILATGHSARDIFELLHRQGILIEAKPFAMGVRVEHPQSLIDKIQYHCSTERHPKLPAASYSLVQQVEGKGVYSFCMCPGGIICPAATSPDEVVVNGWSPSKRNSPYANSGMVVSVEIEDFYQKGNPLEAMWFQQAVEQSAERAGGGKQVAPAQALADFVAGKASANLPVCSYLPGITPADLGEVLPEFIHQRLREGFTQFGKRMKGYLSNDAIVVAVESRTSSPVRIPRDSETLMHPQVQGLYPCAEGAGYAGGIMSAAMDGERVAEKVVESRR